MTEKCPRMDEWMEALDVHISSIHYTERPLIQQNEIKSPDLIEFFDCLDRLPVRLFFCIIVFNLIVAIEPVMY
jgi:hypothetical protein